MRNQYFPCFRNLTLDDPKLVSIYLPFNAAVYQYILQLFQATFPSFYFMFSHNFILFLKMGYRLMLFHGCYIAFHGFSDPERQQMEDNARTQGS